MASLILGIVGPHGNRGCGGENKYIQPPPPTRESNIGQDPGRTFQKFQSLDNPVAIFFVAMGSGQDVRFVLEEAT